MWTMDELVDRVRRALTAGYPGAPNGRVRDLPDRRAIRWYTTTGLVDRPLGMRGRTALYGPRHLLQLVAVKRRQAAGHTLAEIQAELAGATDAALRPVARVPEDLLVADGPAPEDSPGRARFWTLDPVSGTPQAAGASDTGAGVPPRPARAGPATDPATEVRPVGGVALPGGAVLVLPGTPSTADREAIAVAARPLLQLLAERGLLTFDDGSPS